MARASPLWMGRKGSQMTSTTMFAGAKARSSSLILLTMCLGVLVAQIDTSVVNLALKHINSDLQADVSRLQWVIDAYNMTYASLLLRSEECRVGKECRS